MKSRLLSCITGITFLSLSLAGASPAQATDAKAARALFRNPPREYATAPLWVWNDLLTEEQVRGTMRDLAGQKVNQVFVHPRPGLMTPYLSPDWFRLWKVALDEARKLDMNVWIYDENSYPSGFAGGLVPEAMPESRGRGLAIKEVKAAPKFSDDIVGVYALDGETAQNVTARVRAGEELPAGPYIVATEIRANNTPWNANHSYVNLLSPGVTEKFLELTLEPYRREIGREFGRRVPGAFTDEPNIRPAGGFPWSEVLAAEFEKRWGYSLLDNLASLAKPVGDWRKVRHNYFQVLHEQFVAHWARPYRDYCASNHLDFTGHYWDHDWPNCLGVPDNMGMYAWHQRPAIDCLMNQYAENTHAQFGNVRMVRELSSIANQFGKRRTLCEAYGAGGWDLRFEDMKRIGDWLEVLGVNTFDQHLSYITIRGARKRDHPQSFSYHEPWWAAYHVSAQYLARLSAALSQGEQVNRILVLEPTTTAWMYQGDGRQLAQLADPFFKLLLALEAAQVEYDLGSENTFASASAGPGGLKIGNRVYAKVVLPAGCENLNANTARLLAGFLAGGGTVLSCGDAPTRLDGSVSEQAAALPRSGQWKQVAAEALPGQLSNDGLQFTRPAGDAGILFHHRRQLADGDLVFLVNTSIQSPSTGSLAAAGKGGVEQWDLYTGKTAPYAFAKDADGVRAQFTLPPSGSLLLFLSKSPRPPVAAPAVTQTGIPPDAAPQIRRLQPNVLTLDYVDVSAGGETKKGIYFYPANQFVWQKNGLERDPWDSAVQFKDELIRRTFPADSGFEASYAFQIEGAVPKDLAIVIERPDLYRSITCNGKPVQARQGDWWLDKAFGRIALADAAQTGGNVVTVKATPFTIYHELEPAYLLGDFSLRPAAAGFVVVPPVPLTLGASSEAPAVTEPNKPGSERSGWNRQGHPFYAAGVGYAEQFTLKKLSGHYSVALTDWYGSVAKVTVNGKMAGWIDAPPWQCDVTKQLRRGANRIEVTVIGTLKNTLGPHHGNPGLGAAWPAAFHKGPASQPPGSDYSTVAYGLFAPFTLKQTSTK